MKKILSWLPTVDFQEAWVDKETGKICVMYFDYADLNELQTIRFSEIEELDYTEDLVNELKEEFNFELNDQSWMFERLETCMKLYKKYWKRYKKSNDEQHEELCQIYYEEIVYLMEELHTDLYE